jgi:GAF domain-containing protein
MRAPATHRPDSASLPERYACLTEEIEAVVDGESDVTARMATTASMLAEAFDHFSWTGFYVVDPARSDQLVVGPYQGSLGCLRIDFGRGVCGTAAALGETLVVADVDAFPGHIACDSRSRSEIVVPVLDHAGRLIAVLDVDSFISGAFGPSDARGLEDIVRRIFAR